MKEATGELNMTVVTIVLIGVIAAFFAIFWPTRFTIAVCDEDVDFLAVLI